MGSTHCEGFFDKLQNSERENIHIVIIYFIFITKFICIEKEMCDNENYLN